MKENPSCHFLEVTGFSAMWRVNEVLGERVFLTWRTRSPVPQTHGSGEADVAGSVHRKYRTQLPPLRCLLLLLQGSSTKAS